MRPVNVSGLAAAIRLDRTTLVRNLKPLEDKGYIIDTSAKGTRNRQLELSDAGREVYRSAVPRWEAAQNLMETSLGIDQLKILTELLNKIEKISGSSSKSL